MNGFKLRVMKELKDIRDIQDVDAKSGVNRTVIPGHAGHPFRTMADSHSG